MAKRIDNLCTECGLCCDGSLFADVELAGARETSRMELMGVEVDDMDRLLIQPCAALKNKRCNIYQFRPECCRTFECRLLQLVTRGALTMDSARGQISDVRGRISHLQAQLPASPGDAAGILKERCEEAIATLSPGNSVSLESEWTALESLIQKTFLSPISNGNRTKSIPGVARVPAVRSDGPG